jgi:hypothetical protein
VKLVEMKNPLSSLKFSADAAMRSRKDFPPGAFEDAKSLARIPLYFWRDLHAGRFSFGGKEYGYFYHPYNGTWSNERCVEIPIALAAVREAQSASKSVLEVGNVLSHYFPVRHDVVDKYEKAPGVQNEDIVSYSPGRTYDLIVSISTLEHVGFDEEKRDHGKALLAFRKLGKLCSPGGSVLVTFAMGYNPGIDSLALQGGAPGFSWSFMKRDARSSWRECLPAEAAGSRYGTPYPFANALAVGEFSRKA